MTRSTPPAALESASPLDGPGFAALMRSLEPFEPQPRLAAAVSGGADSMALAVLLHEWARARGGSVAALTVDHGLRRGSAAEARGVAARLTAMGVEARVLRWDASEVPRANLQAAARAARYRLLTDWCARHGVLHLALAHHREDQAETLLLRLGRGSGLDGLAGMAPVAEVPAGRLLRPLLSVPRASLEATLRARGVTWVEDPSNRDRSHARVRLRQLAPSLAREGLSAARLAATAAHLGRARVALEAVVAERLAAAATPHPAGFLWLEPAALAGAPREVRLRALARVLMAVGGGAYTPRLASLERLEARLAEGLHGGATLGGCRVVPRKGRLLVVREAAAARSQRVSPGQKLHWDGRFDVRLTRAWEKAGSAGLSVGPLGAAGWRALAAAAPELRERPIPPAARAALPALFDRGRVREVPHLGYRRVADAKPLIRQCRFTPSNPLTPMGFTVA